MGPVRGEDTLIAQPLGCVKKILFSFFPHTYGVRIQILTNRTRYNSLDISHKKDYITSVSNRRIDWLVSIEFEVVGGLKPVMTYRSEIIDIS